MNFMSEIWMERPDGSGGDKSGWEVKRVKFCWFVQANQITCYNSGGKSQLWLVSSPPRKEWTIKQQNKAILD